MRALTFLSALLLGLAPLAASAQHPDEEAVLATVVRLFDGMRAADSSAVRTAFHPIATLYSVGADRSGAPVVRASPVDRFIEAIGTPHEEVWEERLGEAEVRLDGDLATVWVPYAFYLGDAFSHCGTNAFHLARTDGLWRIIHITDTRRTDTCDPSIE